MANVLLVEDDYSLRELYGTVLRAAGHSVRVVGDGLPVFGSIDRSLPVVLVLDLGVPDASAWSVYDHARSDSPYRHLPIVIFSAKNLRGIEKQDVASVLPHPIEPDTLLWAIEKVVRSVRSGDV